jgi:hypothetical protein
VIGAVDGAHVARAIKAGKVDLDDPGQHFAALQSHAVIGVTTGQAQLRSGLLPSS